MEFLPRPATPTINRVMYDSSETPLYSRSMRNGRQLACKRCHTRKQGCDNRTLTCGNCLKANVRCIPRDRQRRAKRGARTSTPGELDDGGLAGSRKCETVRSHDENGHAERSPILYPAPPYGTPPSPPSRGTAGPEHNIEEAHEPPKNIADVVGFLSLGGSGGQSYIGSSSGFALAVDLSKIVQATVWNKALSSMDSSSPYSGITISEIRSNGADPPDDVMGARMLDAYLTRIHPLYPFLDRTELKTLHAERLQKGEGKAETQFGTFRLYMVYAIGSTLLKMTEGYNYTPPERFFMTALQYMSAAREASSINSIEAMTLLVIYHLRSPSNSGIWYMIGLAIRSCIDLGLHREAHYVEGDIFKQQLKKRLFWTVYSLERQIAISFGRPCSIADQSIDVSLPLDIDDDIRDPITISNARNHSRASLTSTLTMGIYWIKLKQIESRIQRKIYRVDQILPDLVRKIDPILQILDEWRQQMPPMAEAEADYPMIQYNKAIRLLLQPFLGVLNRGDHRIALCLQASGQICQIFRRLHSRNSYGHSFIALHSIFVAGMTMCYCLWISHELWTFQTSNDLRACSTLMHIMAERTPAVRTSRDALEELINATMTHMETMAASQSLMMTGVNYSPTEVHQLPFLQVSPTNLLSICDGDDAALQMLYQMTNLEDQPREYWPFGPTTGPFIDLDDFHIPSLGAQ